MIDINKTIQIGRITRDAELKSTNSGSNYSQFSIAVNSYAKGENDYVNFFDVKIWGVRAEKLTKHLTKGKRIAVDGELRWSSWENSDGKKHSKVEILANNIQLLDPKTNNSVPDSVGQAMGAFNAEPQDQHNLNDNMDSW